jgi:hypothetical protein
MKNSKLCYHEKTRIEIYEGSTHYCYKKCIDCGKHVAWHRQTYGVSVDITINYELKDWAKSHGAFWDPSRRTWYIPDFARLKPDNPLIDNITDMPQLERYIKRCKDSEIIISQDIRDDYYQDSYYQDNYFKGSY